MQLSKFGSKVKTNILFIVFWVAILQDYRWTVKSSLKEWFNFKYRFDFEEEIK